MSEQAATVTRQTAAPETSSRNELKLQRKCACGQHTLDGQRCDECKKRSKLQRWAANRPGPAALLASRELADLPAPVNGGSGFDLSRVSAYSPTLSTPRRVQRVARGEAATGDQSALDPTDANGPEAVEAPAPEATPEAAPGLETVSPEGAASPEPAPEAARDGTPEATPEAPTSSEPATLIADDATTDLQPGQLRKADFMDQLQAAVCAETETALAGTEHSATGCPYLAYFFGYYRRQGSEGLERTLRRYVPGARGARSASEYIPFIASRVRQGVEHWARTGEVTGVPEGAPRLAAARAVAAGTRPAAPAVVQFKAHEGGGRRSDDPEAVQAALGPGRPLDSGVRSRMESAYGRSFSGVRLHTGATASRLSSEQNARAFTVGQHAAFSSGEYRPGTPVGDALIAHELAHVVQQGSESGAVDPMERDSASYNALEEDADRSAMGALVALSGGAKEALSNLTPAAIPNLHSGLRLQRCTSNCPTTINANTTLSNDCANAIVIEADNVTLNCGGHTLTGSGSGSGITLSGRRGVTVNNCRVTNFRNGVALRDSSANTFEANTSFLNTADGFDLNGSPENRFINNVARDNTDHGFEFDLSGSNIMEGNTATGNGDGFDASGINRPDSAPSPGNTFLNNIADRNDETGFRISSNLNTLRGNVASNSTGRTRRGDGFRIEGNDNILISNRGGRNRDDDLDVRDNTTGNSCSGNVFGTTNGRCPPDVP